MKRYLLLVGVVAAFIACNNNNNPTIKELTPENVIECVTRLADLDSAKITSLLGKLDMEVSGSLSDEYGGVILSTVSFETRNYPSDDEMSNITKPVFEANIYLRDNKFYHMDGFITIPEADFVDYSMQFSRGLYGYLKKQYPFRKASPETNYEVQNHWNGDCGSKSYTDIKEHFYNMYMPDNETTYNDRISKYPNADNTREMFLEAMEDLTPEEIINTGSYEYAVAGRTSKPACKLSYSISYSPSYVVINEAITPASGVYDLQFSFDETRKATSEDNISEGWAW